MTGTIDSTSQTLSSSSERRLIQHANGQTTAYIYDTFTDPWKSSETILIQHGFGRTADHFYHWVPAFARRYNIIRRDLRGHGLSSYPRAFEEYSYTTSQILDEIKDLLDQLGIQKVHFLGESTSGILAEIFAAKYPDRVSSIIVCSSPTHLPPAAQQFLAFGEDSWPGALRKLGSYQWAMRLSTFPGTMASTDPDYIKWWANRVAQSDGEGLAGYAEFLCQLDSRPYLSKIKAPMLILAPMSSAVITVASMEELAEKVPAAKLVLVEARGHEIYFEAAEVCQSEVTNFLNNLEGSAGDR